MHHLVVREGQYVIFREGVEHGEGHLVVVVLAVDGVHPHVIQHVVHPAHVPLKAEARAASILGINSKIVLSMRIAGAETASIFNT